MRAPSTSRKLAAGHAALLQSRGALDLGSAAARCGSKVARRDGRIVARSTRCAAACCRRPGPAPPRCAQRPSRLRDDRLGRTRVRPLRRALSDTAGAAGGGTVVVASSHMRRHSRTSSPASAASRSRPSRPACSVGCCVGRRSRRRRPAALRRLATGRPARDQRGARRAAAGYPRAATPRASAAAGRHASPDADSARPARGCPSAPARRRVARAAPRTRRCARNAAFARRRHGAVRRSCSPTRGPTRSASPPVDDLLGARAARPRANASTPRSTRGGHRRPARRRAAARAGREPSCSTRSRR
jgi:hypothetical protein